MEGKHIFYIYIQMKGKYIMLAEGVATWSKGRGREKKQIRAKYGLSVLIQFGCLFTFYN